MNNGMFDTRNLLTGMGNQTYNGGEGIDYNTLIKNLMAFGQGSGGGGSNFMNQVDTGGVATAAPTWLQGMTGYTTADGMKVNGWGSTALGAAQGAFGAYSSMKSLGLAEDQLKESKRQFNKNYESQRNLTNTRMQDRQAARVASNPSAYKSVSEYMKENGV